MERALLELLLINKFTIKNEQLMRVASNEYKTVSFLDNPSELITFIQKKRKSNAVILFDNEVLISLVSQTRKVTMSDKETNDSILFEIKDGLHINEAKNFSINLRNLD